MKLLKKYLYIWIVPVYMIFYLSLFAFVESRTDVKVHILHSNIDSYIPFCEYFIIPYFLWFLYIAFVVLYFMFFNKNKMEYYSLIINLGIGMTLFLIISIVFPNGHDLRPVYTARNNIFIQLVNFLYTMDTPTNIFPSIHVYNSVAAHIAIVNCEKLKKYSWIKISSFLLSVSIILSTVLLKQHTIIDVIGALILNNLCYLFIYKPQLLTEKPVAYSKKF